MAFNMNDAMRRAGSRSRGTYTPPVMPGSLPNIGQTPAVQAANIVTGQMGQVAQAGGAPAATQAAGAAGAAQQTMASPMAAPVVQPMTATMHPPGTPADPNQYNYEPQPDGAWRVYPPGVQAPPHMHQASLPKAASTADYQRMSQAFQQPQPGY